MTEILLSHAPRGKSNGAFFAAEFVGGAGEGEGGEGSRGMRTSRCFFKFFQTWRDMTRTICGRRIQDGGLRGKCLGPGWGDGDPKVKENGDGGEGG